MVVEKMISDPQTELLLVLSMGVSLLVQDEIQATKGGRHCDWILGWVRSEHHPLQQPLAIRSDLWILLNMLYKDRKLFLSALASTFSPGLSGVLFLLWRYIDFDRFVFWPAEIK
jgi:hypothetical protein